MSYKHIESFQVQLKNVWTFVDRQLLLRIHSDLATAHKSFPLVKKNSVCVCVCVCVLFATPADTFAIHCLDRAVASNGVFEHTSAHDVETQVQKALVARADVAALQAFDLTLHVSAKELVQQRRFLDKSSHTVPVH
jgi:hypothetical protein